MATFVPENNNEPLNTLTDSSRRRILALSLVFSFVIAGVMIVFAFTTRSADASTYTSSAPGNWTGGATWICAAGAPGSTACGAYPGSSTVNGDIANVNNASYTVNTVIPGAVTLNMINNPQNVTVAAGGVLGLTGNSAVTSSSGVNVLTISGGTVSNTGTLTIGGSGSGRLDFNGGTLNGGGTTTMVAGGTFNMTGTAGAMAIDQQQVSNGANAAFTATNTLTLSNGANFFNASGGTFTANSSGSIAAGAGTVLFKNAGSVTKGGGLAFTLGLPVENTSSVSVFSTGTTINFNGGSGPAGHSNATWNLGGPGGVMSFGGNHVFNNAQTFTGNGTINANGGFTINTSTPAMTLPSGVNLTNAGTVDFGTATHNVSVGGNYSQSGTIRFKLGPTNGVSDAVNVPTGSATLGGTLIAALAPGYVPVNGDTFTVVTDTAQSGTFSYTPLAYSNGFFQIVYNATSVQLVAVPQADIVVSKSGPPTVIDTQNATYTVTVANNGPSAASVVIDDTFSNAAFVSASTPSGTCTGTGPISCSIPSLLSGTSTTITVVLKATALGTITNTASRNATSSTPTDPNSANDSAAVSTTVNPLADLGVSVSGPATANAATAVTDTATVVNNGPDSASATVNLGVTNGTFTSVSGAAFTCTNTATSATCTSISPLPSGSSNPITIALLAPSQAATMTVNAVVSSAVTDLNGTNQNGSAATVISAVSDLAITKTGPASATAGQNVVYNITVSNTAGPSDATGVTVNDTPPAGATFVSNSGACTTTFPCALGTIPAGSTVTFTSTYTVPSNATGSIVNSATVASSSNDPLLGNNTSSVTTPVATSADLSIVKSLTSTLIAGSNATYSIVVTNNGPSDATGVTVSDSTPPGTTFVSNTGACTTPFPCSIGTLTAGSTATITTTFLVASAATGSISNTASVNATTPDPNLPNNSSTATGTIGTNADVQITKTGPATANPGQNVTFNISIVNNGPSSATGIAVADPTPAGMTFVSNTGGCSTAFPCAIGSLGAGGSAGISSTYTIATTASGTLSNTASVSSTSTDPTPGNNSSTATVAINAASDLSILKTGPANASPGQTITYAVTVTNNGPSASAPVTVSDPTPAGLTFVSNSGACTTAYPCSIGSLSAGQTVSIASTYTVSTTASGPITNTASVSSATPDPVAGNNSSAVTTTVTPKADLAITKTGPATLPASGPITFNIVVRNNGPSTANNVFVNDSPGPGLGFISNSGGCSTPFPCSFATVASGATITIQSKYNVSSGVASVTNTADVNSSTPDPNNANNSSTVTVKTGNTCPSGTLSQFQPFSGQQDVPTSGVMQWTNLGASSYEVYMGPAGTGTACSTLVATVNGTSYNYTGLTPNTDYESRIIAVQPGCPSIASQCIRWRTASGGCNLTAPVLQSPAAGTTVGGSTTLKWSAVSGATSYHVVVIVNGITQVDTTTTDTFLDVTVPNGNATWSVTAIGGNCTSPSANGTFGVCGAPAAPVAGVVGAPTSGNAYSVIVVVPSPGAVSYDFQEATDASFGSVITQNTNATSLQYSHTTNVPQVFFYRVRAIGACTNTAGPFSKPVRVVIVPAVQDLRNPKINVPAGNKNLVVVQVFVPGDSSNENFVATSDRPWVVRIDPSSGILTPQGITLNVTIDPSQLPNGTFTATVIVNTSPISGSSRLVTNGSGKSVPVSINLVTPVVPVNPNAPTADSIFIPVVGHLAGLNSQWRSDIRIYNASPQTLQYLLNFTPQGSTDVKQTTLTTLSGDTTALDDIIHNWFGVGEVGDSSTGSLEIRPMTTDGSTTPPKGSAFTTVASSRTFNATSDGTVGQFIPPVAFSNFIGSGARLSMQQLAQSPAYRTNFGLLEGSGAPVSLVLSMFNSSGTKLFDLPVDLAAGEQKLLNGLLAEKGVTLNDGRMEVKVASGDGKVTAYASVIDNASLDPQLVPGQNLTNTTSKLYVVPGVADLNNGVASWRTDMRIYNSSNTPQSTDLAFYPQDKSAPPFFATISVNPNEVKVLDSIVQSLFGTHDLGGMVRLTTPTDSQLVVTARTYNQTANGTLGQFIKAATAAEGITANTKSLNILEVEDSPRFRTNLGLAEMTGKPVTVEVSVILPDSKVTPSIQVPLAANEFRQFGVAQFGLGNIYNARVSVKVIDGAGSITAYGSVIDQVTTDPTFVQAQ